MAVIRVPKTPKKAYNPHRRAGTLLQSQLLHLEWAVRPAGERTAKAFQIKRATTEATAARRIEQLTIELHRQSALRGTEPAAAVPPQPQPAAHTVRKPKAMSKAKPKSHKTAARKQATAKKRKKR